ncbi:unnamed protein product, partial [Didymodactylos carnosus]
MTGGILCLESLGERLLRKHSKSRNSNKNDCNLRLLTWEQKLDIIIAELEQMKSEKQNTTNIDKIELLEIKIALQLESKNYQTILNNIKKQEELIDQTQQDIIYLQQEIVDAENTNKMLIGQRQNYKLSDAFSYVKKKSLFYQLQQDVQVWERKVEIAK